MKISCDDYTWRDEVSLQGAGGRRMALKEALEDEIDLKMVEDQRG